MGLKHHAALQFFGVLKGSREGACDGLPAPRRLRLEHAWVCKPVLRNALGLSLEQDSGGVVMPLSKRSQDAPEPLSKWSGRVPRSVFGWNA